MHNIELTDEQLHLIKELKTFFRSGTRPWYAYSGPPGTGKSTIIRVVIDELQLLQHEVIAVSYTGKATLRLLMDGLNASTIHSLIYRPSFITELDEKGDPILKSNGKLKKKLIFELKEKLPDSLRLIFADEYSMINDSMCRDLLSFGIPVIFGGDVNQLPPVFGENTMITPNFYLTKIMRQAEGDPIIHISQCILHDKPVQVGQYGKSMVTSEIALDHSIINDYNLILCGKNALRETINSHIHEKLLGRKERMPHIGDKVICKQNNWHRYVYHETIHSNIYLTNGLIGYIEDFTSHTGKYGYIDFRPDFMDACFFDLELDIPYFSGSLDTRLHYGMTRYNKFELGWAITVHASQGSQINRLLYFDQPFWDSEMTKKIRYTAVTRAIDQIVIVLDRFKERM